MNQLSLSKILAVIALIVAVASVWVDGPLVVIAIILLAVAVLISS